LQASHREAASAHDPVMPRHAAPNQQGGGIGKQRMLRAMDAIRRGINDTIDTIVEIPAKTSAGVFAKLRLTQFYEPEGVSSSTAAPRSSPTSTGCRRRRRSGEESKHDQPALIRLACSAI
jgi:hypothetical protein